MSSPIQGIPIEPEADLLVDFVNTLDPDTGEDSIGEPDGLRRWMVEHAGLAVAIDAEGPRRLVGLRESLRALLIANNGGEMSDRDLQPLRQAAARSSYQASFGPDGRLGLDPAGDGAEAIEARLLLAVERLQALGVWPRLKACPADDCEWAFYDTSRNRSRTWCSMEVCGNREKTRRYRQRRATG